MIYYFTLDSLVLYLQHYITLQEIEMILHWYHPDSLGV